MFDFLNKDNYMLGFLCLNVDLMLDLVLHLKGFGKVAVDLAIHQERPTRVEGGAGHGDWEQIIYFPVPYLVSGWTLI
jgi:hypothetical protein